MEKKHQKRLPCQLPRIRWLCVWYAKSSHLRLLYCHAVRPPCCCSSSFSLLARNVLTHPLSQSFDHRITSKPPTYIPSAQSPAPSHHTISVTRKCVHQIKGYSNKTVWSPTKLSQPTEQLLYLHQSCASWPSSSCKRFHVDKC